MCSGHPLACGNLPEAITILFDDCASIRTSIVALRLTCARLHFHASGASKPREASNASAGNSG